MPEQRRKRDLVDFGVRENGQSWQVVNDTVMGGVSESHLEFTPEGTAIFAGRVSLENNGGFASVRSPQSEHDLSDSEGVAVRVRGDGKTYKLGLRTDTASDGVFWLASFGTQRDIWQEVRIPLDEFLPTHHGTMLEGVPPLDRSGVRSFSLLIADEQEGSFSLEVAWVRAY